MESIYTSEDEENDEILFSQLTADKRKRMQNKTCTLKQSKRYYKNQTIIKNIDRRFTINEIKNILKYENIPFYAVNTPKSKTTGLRDLHIGIYDAEQISIYTNKKTRNRFTVQESNETPNSTQ
ncbi:hypothetical protein I4U23_016982 [Adineta vaga]|nr:hypothetical protein I4U23_016982 [Adineta vaga]